MIRQNKGVVEGGVGGAGGGTGGGGTGGDPNIVREKGTEAY